MEWRCEWCGKPHAEDDPPCDECGHGTFERAVVQQPAEGPAGDSTTVWVCTECGREHTKHAPPCSRCGNATLERREQTVDDSELVAPGYLDLVTTRYIAGLAVALVLGTVLVLGLLGVVDLPGMDSGVPGSGETYQGIALADVESEYVDHVNERRATDGYQQLQETGALDEAARSYNQQYVQNVIRGNEVAPVEAVRREVRQSAGENCAADLTVVPFAFAAEELGATAEQMGASIAREVPQEFDVGENAPQGQIGVDVHVARGGVFLTQVTC